MNKLEKMAYAELQNKVNAFELNKERLQFKLLKQDNYAKMHKKENELIISLSKEPENEKLNAELKKVKKQKNDFLKENNYEFLLCDNLCPICQDKGFINGKPCSCLKKIMSETALKNSGLDIDLNAYAKVDFDIFENSEKIKKTYSTIDKWIAKYDKSDIRNWAFMGHTGTGKTHLMFYMAKKLINLGAYIYFTTAYKLTQDLLAEYTEDLHEKENFINKYIDCDILFIDDLGTEINNKKVANNLLYTIFNQRMLENKPIIFSTNFDMSELEEFYGERIFSRLINKRTTKALWFDGIDLRLK